MGGMGELPHISILGIISAVRSDASVVTTTMGRWMAFSR